MAYRIKVKKKSAKKWSEGHLVYNLYQANQVIKYSKAILKENKGTKDKYQFKIVKTKEKIN